MLAASKPLSTKYFGNETYQSSGTTQALSKCINDRSGFEIYQNALKKEIWKPSSIRAHKIIKLK